MHHGRVSGCGAEEGVALISPGITASATNAAAAQARTDFLSAYAALEAEATNRACTQVDGSLAAQNLAPGVYCTDAVAKTGVLTLNGPSNGVWIFLVDGALTGTNFTVVMAGGGQPCNVYWTPSVAVPRPLLRCPSRGQLVCFNRTESAAA